MKAKQGKMTVGFIGLGRMGGPMAQRLLGAGHNLLVHDVDAAAVARLVKAGARRAASVRAVADQAQVIFASLPTPAVLREVALGRGGIADGKAVKVFVDLSTTGSAVEEEVGAGLAKRRIGLVDAPVSGGIAGAQRGTLAVMVAGAARNLDPVRPMLEVIGKVFVVGDKPGQAQVMKVCNNLLGANALAATAEVMVMGAKAGLDADTMIAVINAGSGRNSATQDKFPKAVLTRSFDFGFSIDGYCKDIGLGIAEAKRLGCTTWVCNAVKHLYDFAQSQGAGKEDLTAIVKFVEHWAGTEVRGKAAPRAVGGRKR